MERKRETKREIKRGNQWIKLVAGLLALASVGLAVYHGVKGDQIILLQDQRAFYAVAAITLVAGLIMVICALYGRRFIGAAVGVIQFAGLVCFDWYIGRGLESVATLCIDWFAVLIVLLTGLMGGIICWRTGGSITVLLSMLAVDGLAMADDLLWIYMFWTVLTVCSYHVITSDGKSAAECAVRMLTVNSWSGLSLLAGIAVSGIVFETVDITTLNLIDTAYADMIAMAGIFVVFAGIIRAMQMPFQGWFTHEYKMSAGTASIIQSVTLVNSGAILVIKMSVSLGITNFAGLMAIIIGGVTFFSASLDAITELKDRKMLADSTSATMGLIILCVGIGTSESTWAAIILLVFHSVAKPLLLEGTEADHLKTDLVMAVIVMMAAPFAIVLLQRESLGSIADTGNVILVMIMCFSGAIAIFYWTRWLGTLISDAVTKGIEPIRFFEMNPSKANAWLLIIVLLGMPFLSMYIVVPYMEGVFGGMSSAANLTDNILDSVVISLAVALAAYPIYKGVEPRPRRIEAYDQEDETETHAILRRSRSAVRAQLICNVLSIGIILLCVGFILVNLAELLGGGLQ